MLDGFWAFLKDPANQAVLGWICGGLAALAAGAWAVIRFFAGKGGDDPAPTVKAENKSVASGHDITNSPINIDTRHSGKR